ncbi:MAG: shikimate kinase [Janthinobacterium lividum]
MPKEFTQETTVPETHNIVLIGFMGTGKSAVGRVLARRTQFRHLDLDSEIEQAAGKTIPQIFAEEGEPAFRARETAFLSSLSAPEPQDQPLILSTGGGTPLREENAVLLKKIGTIVWLQVSPEAILARVAHSLHERPLLAAHQDDPLRRITSLLAVREAHYAALADFVLETSDCADSEEGASRLMERLSILPSL